LVLILNTFIVFHAATIGWQRRVRHGVFTLIRVLLLSDFCFSRSTLRSSATAEDGQPLAFSLLSSYLLTFECCVKSQTLIEFPTTTRP
jgi:hypothetical protein